MFIDISYVEILNLNHNRIKMITVSSLIGLKAYVLELSHNLIEDLEDRSIPEVKKMYINNNKLILIHSKMFVNISKTYKLDVSCNNITSFNFENSDFILLNMSYNQITYLSQNSFSAMNLIRNLSLSNNVITSLETKSIPKVEYLDLSYNLLTSIEANMFTDVDLLKSLDINNNCIKYIDLKLAEKLIFSNRKLNEKCTLDANRITETDTFLLSKSAVYTVGIIIVVVVIAAILIKIYSRCQARTAVSSEQSKKNEHQLKELTSVSKNGAPIYDDIVPKGDKKNESAEYLEENDIYEFAN
ncbi:PREDICTED: leucine-rich repeat-containing protein egg-6-like [Nicrophorus vespilloides]|uniref:Leucine-rich repeat-containing protein egg-6-like n=1 Tax=Nicrophorus vespilloides TaxID=110193 RepID=A0ABM1N7U6_NICVS|nr:PREDICTED: leucine-rich repeat-containing protein egg-6-like [Nicrophorus vespilloides]